MLSVGFSIRDVSCILMGQYLYAVACSRQYIESYLQYWMELSVDEPWIKLNN